MELYCFDPSIDLISMVENFSSLEWLEEYNGLGAFKLLANYTEENVVNLTKGNLLWKSDGETSGVIEYIHYENNIIECRGRLTNKLLDDRIILETIDINIVESGLRFAVFDNCIDRNPIPNLALGENNRIPTIGNKQISHKTVYDAINSYRNMGFKVIFNQTLKQHEVEFYEGVDRNLDVMFSEEFENIYDNKITSDDTEYKNVAYVYGDGEEGAQELVIVDLSDGNSRRELYVDAKDIQQGELINAEYTELLQERGTERLSEQIQVDTFKCNIKPNGIFKYKEDFYLGDFVSCKSVKYKVKFKVRISQIREVYDNKGYQIVATLGEQNKEEYYG